MLVLGGEGGYDGRVMRIMGQKWVAMVAVADQLFSVPTKILIP